MGLPDDIYKIFESIVGKGNLTDDPVILETYSFNWLVEFLPEVSPSKYIKHKPIGVILPGSVKEVQEIVKVCNRYGIKFKAFSTGYGAHSLPGQPGVLIMDLRRMDRIIDIDEKNKFAIVEPYVNWAELTAEAIKVGLFTTPVQAGSQASVLANVTSGWGMNTFGNHGGHNGKNALGIEWVLPSGELLKLGPEDGWFTGDGPGPSLRGIMRGHCGAQGGLGVFTKAAVKLHHWPGPPKLETIKGGIATTYLLKDMPKYFKVFSPSFDTYDEMTDFFYKIGDEEIGYALIRAGGVEHMLSMLGGISLKDLFEQFYETGIVDVLKEEIKHPCFLVIFATTEREFEYQQKVALKAIGDTGGKLLPALNEGPFYETFIKELPIVLIGNDTHFIHHTGGFVISAGYMGTADSVVRHMGIPAEMVKKKYSDKGVILPDGLDSTYHNSFENNAYIYMEMEFHYDASNPVSVQGSREAIAEERDTNRSEKLGFEPNDIGLVVGDSKMSPQQRVEEIGKYYQDFHKWQKMIKEILDPDDISDGSNYGAGAFSKPGLVKK